MNGCVYHYRDQTGLECDAVIHLRNGDYSLIEIKLGGEIAIEQGAATLKKLRDRNDTENMKEPSFLILQFLSTHPCGVRPVLARLLCRPWTDFYPRTPTGCD